MAKKPNVLPHPQNALKKFMDRIRFEQRQLDRAYNLDGNTINIFKVKPHSGTRSDSDDVGGLVDSHLEDMYHSLYGEPLELRKLLIDAKGESVKAGVEFKLTLNPLLDAMFDVHESSIESLRTGRGWNMEAHCKAFDKLSHELGAYNERIYQLTANPVDKLKKPKPIAKKLKPLSEVEVERAKWILKTKKRKYKGSPITDVTIALILKSPESFPPGFRPDSNFGIITTKQGVFAALKRFANSKI